ncbi:hypothetical protein LTR99_009374 [Exophiala xenobiotica]|uniref:Flavoprotein oxygenase n=1 Tax=Vermiconidia calcicola TaxID=1690605 RepID=A0AAV9PXB5_9PEZI|nr:hypothetical protein LTR92_002201 [Exophiala xenobiotica]KAK5530950.1 hypothetical protein LTR25_008807 [Vermiconidia calcicola]KAK5544442.1 hypothetical protein LTR23_004530 [Chaetothyriales sp. CCFEE 6169]KAK5210295.1 hypothetical protein LTR41_003963 [Exophiala xenobiotica]KAK5228489.1 hypothetical protein LTR72_002373 [Exophiala xenobiotica]
MPISHSSSPSSTEIIEGYAFQHSSPLSLRQQPLSSPPAPPCNDPSQDHDYNFSGAVYDETTSAAESEDQEEVEDEQEAEVLDNDRRISGCSSISSFPASISQRPASKQSQYDNPRTPTKRDSASSHGFYRYDSGDCPVTSPRSLREYHSPFRHPSSVRALQMRDEIMSDTHSVLRHRRSGSQMSSYSNRSSYSTHTSPTKRSSRSNRGSPHKGTSNLRKEFPLVLLHCTPLPPTLLSQSTSHGDTFINDFLPDEYKKRWITLQDKLIEDVEVRTRGILIAHPREDYELLEERLLESLDLERPRIRHNHYFPHDGNGGDSGFESGSVTSDETDNEAPSDSKCPDCGRRLRPDETPRKWEVKVFAANGLMKAGAWAAAWQEMEKVDVEIKVWLPEEVRRDLEAKIALIETPPVDNEEVDPEYNINKHESAATREQEVYGASGRVRSQSEIDGFLEESKIPQQAAPTGPRPLVKETDLTTLMLASMRKLSHDHRNFILGMLSCLVLFLALVGRNSSTGYAPSLNKSIPTHVAETLTTTVTTTSVAIATATVTTSIVAQPLEIPSASEHAASSVSDSPESVLRQLSEVISAPLQPTAIDTQPALSSSVLEFASPEASILDETLNQSSSRRISETFQVPVSELSEDLTSAEAGTTNRLDHAE